MPSDRRFALGRLGRAALAFPSVLSLREAPASVEPSDAWAVHNGAFGDDFPKDFDAKESGLLVRDLEKGSGRETTVGDIANIHMVAYVYEDGSKFTNTYKGIPTGETRLRVGARDNQKFMRGLSEGLVSMKKGGKRVLIIPAPLAYRYTAMLDSNNEVVPAGSALVCYIEMLSFGKESL